MSNNSLTKLTKEQALVIMGYCDVVCLPLHIFHKDVEQRLGRKVQTVEFSYSSFQRELKELYKKDFISLVENFSEVPVVSMKK